MYEASDYFPTDIDTALDMARGWGMAPLALTCLSEGFKLASEDIVRLMLAPAGAILNGTYGGFAFYDEVIDQGRLKFDGHKIGLVLPVTEKELHDACEGLVNVIDLTDGKAFKTPTDSTS
jgi:hypothetical protein